MLGIMSKIEIIKDVVNMIRENKGLDLVQAVTPQTQLRDQLELDSLDLAEFTVRVEKETGVDVFADGIVQTVGEVLERIS
jgi:acyl carrier protein